MPRRWPLGGWIRESWFSLGQMQLVVWFPGVSPQYTHSRISLPYLLEGGSGHATCVGR